ncbi:MAG: HpcH/HpaI aldolase/citrate lyase family protein [Nocardioides sp.]
MTTAWPPGPALLFCPADRPDRFAKAAASADAVILDLEDGVAPANKALARRHLLEHRLDPERTIIRVNPVGTDQHQHDLATVKSTAYRIIMLAKAERAADVRRLAADVGTGLGDGSGPFDRAPIRVIALCETARGVLAANELAAEPATVSLMWGAEDLIVSLGGRSSRHPDGQYRDIAVHARSRVLLAAAAHGKTAIDAVYLDIADLDGLRAEAEDAADSGFAATPCIHPGQASVVRQAYLPTADQLAWASAVLEAATKATGVFRFEGRMVDEPILHQARTLLGRHRNQAAESITVGEQGPAGCSVGAPTPPPR